METIYFSFGVSVLLFLQTISYENVVNCQNGTNQDENQTTAHFYINKTEISTNIILTDSMNKENLTECQNMTYICDGKNYGDNKTGETEFNITTSAISAPTKRPKRKLYRDVAGCPPLPLSRLRNGKIRLLPKERVQYVCNAGYRLRGPSIIRCLEGKWSSTVTPICTLPFSSCDPPESIPHGTILGDEWIDGSTIFYICDLGYTLIGSRARTCKDGYWSEIPPICQDESEPLKNMATKLKNQFIDKVGSYSSDSRGRMIGSDIQHTGLELLLLIDKSSSIDPVNFKEGIEFAKFLVEEFGVENGVNASSTGTRIAVITFSSTADLVVKPTDANIRNVQDAKNILDTLQPMGGGTAINAAFATLVSVAASLRPKAKKAVFLLTDGHNNVPGTPPSEIANDLKKGGMEIFAVGIGRDVKEDEMKSIASEPSSNHVFLLNKFSDLADIMWLIRSSPTEAPSFGPRKCGFLPKLKLKRKNTPEAVPDWPWLAVIYVKHPPKRNHVLPSMGICSGSLICNNWILTSASCFFGEDESERKPKYLNAYVTLGENDLSSKDKTQRNFRIRGVMIHPDFRPWVGTGYDLALVKLADSAPLELTYRPICLPTAEQVFSIQANQDADGNMAGWGSEPSAAFFDGNFASAFNILPQVTKLPFVEDHICKKLKPRNATDTFCAGSRVRWTCSGNLGSPLVIKDTTSNFHYIFGVLNSKKFCRSHYNMFTDISQYVSWINEVTGSCGDLY